MSALASLLRGYWPKWSGLDHRPTAGLPTRTPSGHAFVEGWSPVWSPRWRSTIARSNPFARLPSNTRCPRQLATRNARNDL